MFKNCGGLMVKKNEWFLPAETCLKWVLGWIDKGDSIKVGTFTSCEPSSPS